MKTFAMHSIEIAPGQPAALPVRHGDFPTPVMAVIPGYSKLPVAEVAEDVLLVPDRLPPVPTRRLVVLVPPGEIDENLLTRRVWQLAASSNLQVLYLALSPQYEYIASQRRQLAGLAARTADKDIHAQISLSAEQSWPQALEKIRRPGDLPICLAGHQVSKVLFGRKALGKHLAEIAGMPVYMLGGIKISAAPYRLPWIKETMAWTASIILLAAFFGLQVGIDRAIEKPISTILFLLSMLAEVYFLVKINEWIGQ